MKPVESILLALAIIVLIAAGIVLNTNPAYSGGVCGGPRFCGDICNCGNPSYNPGCWTWYGSNPPVAINASCFATETCTGYCQW